MKKRQLTDTEIAECAALKDIYRARSKELGLTQSRLAEEFDMTQTAISMYLNGVNPLNVAIAARFSSVLGVPVGAFSPRIAEMINRLSGLGVKTIAHEESYSSSAAEQVLSMLENKRLPPEQMERIRQAVLRTEAAEPARQPGEVIAADFSRRPTIGDEIRIAHYDVQGAMGGGKVVHDFPEMFRDVTVSQQHLRELGVTFTDPNHLKLITGSGQSMEPTIQDKDPMIIDASVREFVGDGIYALAWHGHFYIKRLQVADAEHFEMISDNPLHKDRLIRIDEAYIQGKILLIWQAKRV